MEDNMKSEAKIRALKKMKEMVSGSMKDGIKDGLKKVSVASDSKEGLKEGLAKAKELLNGEESPEDIETAEHEASEEDMIESPIDEMVEACSSPEEIDEAIKKLQEKKASLSKY